MAFPNFFAGRTLQGRKMGWKVREQKTLDKPLRCPTSII